VEELPQALIELGLAERLNARVTFRIDPPAYDPERDPDTKMLNPRAIRDYSVKLADAVGAVLSDGDFPVVLGGDCSILLGNLLALRRRARYGLLFIDGHADFYQPEANVNGEAASSELALATGRGPQVMAAPAGYRPLVRDEDVVAFAHRDAGEAARYGSQPLPESLRSIDLATVRRVGADAAARQAMVHLERDELTGFWIHLDADALDDAIMPAVDYRMPHGLSWEELEAVLRRATASADAVGLDVTIYNPRLDPDRRVGRKLVRVIANALV
jgi:arginase